MLAPPINYEDQELLSQRRAFALAALERGRIYWSGLWSQKEVKTKIISGYAWYLFLDDLLLSKNSQNF